MILLLNTGGPICKISFIDGEWRYDDEWRSDRDLAKNLLKYIDDKLKENGKNWFDISAIGAYQGPGSFTGLRIGLTVLNTISDTNKIPIVGGQGDDWQQVALEKLDAGKNEEIVLPFYGGDANITTPRK